MSARAIFFIYTNDLNKLQYEKWCTFYLIGLKYLLTCCRQELICCSTQNVMKVRFGIMIQPKQQINFFVRRLCFIFIFSFETYEMNSLYKIKRSLLTYWWPHTEKRLKIFFLITLIFCFEEIQVKDKNNYFQEHSETQSQRQKML